MPENKPRSRLMEELDGLTAPERYQAARLLEAAAEFPDPQWTQGAKARTPQGHVIPFPPDDPELPEAGSLPAQLCAIGHIERATLLDPDGHRWTRRMMTAVTREIRETLPQWNDHPDRTAEEVRQTFRQAAKRLYQEAVTQALAPEGQAALPVETNDPVAEAFAKFYAAQEKKYPAPQPSGAAAAS